MWHDTPAGVAPAIDNPSAFMQHPEDEMLILSDSGETFWGHDWRWPQLVEVANTMRAEKLRVGADE